MRKGINAMVSCLQGRALSGMVNQYISLVENAGKLSAYKDAEFVALLQVS